MPEFKDDHEPHMYPHTPVVSAGWWEFAAVVIVLGAVIFYLWGYQ